MDDQIILQSIREMVKTNDFSLLPENMIFNIGENFITNMELMIFLAREKNIPALLDNDSRLSRFQRINLIELEENYIIILEDFMNGLSTDDINFFLELVTFDLVKKYLDFPELRDFRLQLRDFNLETST